MADKYEMRSGGEAAASTVRVRRPTGVELEVKRMTAQEWIAVEDNPHQRNVEHHLRTAWHLREDSLSQHHVEAARLPDNTLIKLNGHSRAWIWKNIPGRAPEGRAVVAVIQPARDREHAAELYHHYDNRSAADTAADDLSGAFRAVGFYPKSGLFIAPKGSNAIKIVTLCMMGMYGFPTNLIDIYTAVPAWLRELRMLDSIEPMPSRFTAGFLVAAMLTLRRRGAVALSVWRNYQEVAGEQHGKTYDGALGLSLLRREYKGPQGPAGGSERVLKIAGRALTCVEAALDERLLTSMRITKVANYCESMKREMVKFEELAEAVRERGATMRAHRAALRKWIEESGAA